MECRVGGSQNTGLTAFEAALARGGQVSARGSARDAWLNESMAALRAVKRVRTHAERRRLGSAANALLNEVLGDD